MDIDRRKQNRQEVLFNIYEDTGGNTRQPVSIQEVEEWGYDHEQAASILSYLSDEGLLRITQTDANKRPMLFFITSRGIQRAESIYQENQDTGTSSDQGVSKNQGMDTGSDIFISHSSDDADVAEALVEVLRSAFSLSPDRIRCTSVDGYKLPPGVRTSGTLKQEVRDSEIFIAILTPSSMRSAYVLFELGARWGTDQPMIPVLAKGSFSILDGPLEEINVLNGKNEADIEDVLEEIESMLGRDMNSTSSYRKHVKELANIAKNT